MQLAAAVMTASSPHTRPCCPAPIQMSHQHSPLQRPGTAHAPPKHTPHPPPDPHLVTAVPRQHAHVQQGFRSLAQAPGYAPPPPATSCRGGPGAHLSAHGPAPRTPRTYRTSPKTPPGGSLAGHGQPPSCCMPRKGQHVRHGCAPARTSAEVRTTFEGQEARCMAVSAVRGTGRLLFCLWGLVWSQSGPARKDGDPSSLAQAVQEMAASSGSAGSITGRCFPGHTCCCWQAPAHQTCCAGPGSRELARSCLWAGRCLGALQSGLGLAWLFPSCPAQHAKDLQGQLDDR